VVLVGGRRVSNVLREPKPATLPLETPADGPGEDAFTLGLEFVGQSAVAFCGWDRDRERHQPDPSPDRVIGAADDGSMIRRDHHLEGRQELEVLAIEPARDDRVLAGHHLHEPLGEAPATVGLDGRDEARTAEPGEGGRRRDSAGRATMWPWRLTFSRSPWGKRRPLSDSTAATRRDPRSRARSGRA